LFGEVSLVRVWGRIGTRGRHMEHLFDNESQAINLFFDVLREKHKRGYRPKPPVDIKRI
jgi:predicted DNA-binding WGR domain protein